MKQHKLSTRIYFGFSMFVTATCVIIILSQFYSNIINTKLKKVVDENNLKINLTHELAVSTRDGSRDVYLMFLSTGEESKTGQYNMLKKDWVEYDQTWDKLVKLNSGSQEQDLYHRVEQEKQSARALINQAVELDLSGKLTVDAARLMISQVEPVVKKWNQLLTQNAESLYDLNERLKVSASKDYNFCFCLLWSLYIFGVIAGIFSNRGIIQGISMPLDKILHGLTESSAQVLSASSHLASTSQQLSEGSAEQASAIEETTSTLQESSSMLQANSDNTKQAAQLSQQARESADKGNQEMQEMMGSILEIKKSSDQIAKIIKVIDDIAFQTNILALNAAVEAARAGESGMGFSVVAEEVRNLAQRSAQAVKDTTSIIEANLDISGKGVTVAGKVREALKDITIQARKVNELMAEIYNASQEQSQAISQVTKAMVQMEVVTQQNASNAQDNACASEDLKTQADNMKRMLQEISILINGTEIMLEKEIGAVDIPKPVSAMNNTRQNSNYPEASSNKSNKTKVISPEDIIPLEKDPHHF